MLEKRIDVATMTRSRNPLMFYANLEVPQLLSIHKVHEFSIFHDSMTFYNIRCNIDKKCILGSRELLLQEIVMPY